MDEPGGHYAECTNYTEHKYGGIQLCEVFAAVNILEAGSRRWVLGLGKDTGETESQFYKMKSVCVDEVVAAQRCRRVYTTEQHAQKWARRQFYVRFTSRTHTTRGKHHFCSCGTANTHPSQHPLCAVAGVHQHPSQGGGRTWPYSPTLHHSPLT